MEQIYHIIMFFDHKIIYESLANVISINVFSFVYKLIVDWPIKKTIFLYFTTWLIKIFNKIWLS